MSYPTYLSDDLPLDDSIYTNLESGASLNVDSFSKYPSAKIDLDLDNDDLFSHNFWTDFESYDNPSMEAPLYIRNHDVFLSFRGEDTRASFTSHLSASLQNAGITVFKDDQSLQRGDLISISLMNAIDNSKISIIVFSKNYADSQWCLQELVQVMNCQRTVGQIVLPVFYDVDPSEVRRQTGVFGKAFHNLLNRIAQEEKSLVFKWGNDVLWGNGIRVGNKDMVQKWRHALHQAGGLAGFVVLNSRLLSLLSLFIFMLCNQPGLQEYKRTNS
ncbi:TMV resistance protein N-like [Trifolium medium]|uniref:TMV resistance protein N-like n=1 Tax=Trifolium medium TaxID=97028 RepID=A0A392MKV0_9FABA|nr:TMV resistance protein N-like [Trifolium medium]